VFRLCYKRTLTFRFSDQSFVCVYIFSHTLFAILSSLCSSYECLMLNIVVKFLIMQFLPAHYHLLPRRSTSLFSPPSSHAFSVFLSCPFGTIFFPMESKIIRMRAMKAYRRSRRTSALDRSGWLASRLGRFTSKSKALPFELYSRWAGNRSGTFTYDRNLLPLPKIKPRLLGFLARSLTMTPSTLS